MGLKAALTRVYKHLVEFMKKNAMACIMVFLLIVIAFKPSQNIVVEAQRQFQMPNTNVMQIIPEFEDQTPSFDVVGEARGMVQGLEKIPVVRSQGIVRKVDYSLARNLVADECIRREPRLSGFYAVSSNDFNSPSLPNVGFILDTLETQYGMESLYSNINNSVAKVFNYLKAQGY